eukprot:2174565-Rhodomonas_salina.1
MISGCVCVVGGAGPISGSTCSDFGGISTSLALRTSRMRVAAMDSRYSCSDRLVVAVVPAYALAQYCDSTTAVVRVVPAYVLAQYCACTCRKLHSNISCRVLSGKICRGGSAFRGVRFGVDLYGGSTWPCAQPAARSSRSPAPARSPAAPARGNQRPFQHTLHRAMQPAFDFAAQYCTLRSSLRVER